jgi:transcriptional regulator with XRE-family HTH domain
LPFCSLTLSAQKPSKSPIVPKTLGEHIRKRRLELKLLQREVAQLIGVGVDSVLKWEHNRTKPRLRLLPKVISFLGYNPNLANPESLGGKVLQYRNARGMSQKELAIQIGIDPSTLSRIERGIGRCFESILRKVQSFSPVHKIIEPDAFASAPIHVD